MNMWIYLLIHVYTDNLDKINIIPYGLCIPENQYHSPNVLGVGKSISLDML